MDTSKEAFVKLWSTLSPQEQVSKVYSFLQQNRAGSKTPDDPAWSKLSESSLKEAQAKHGDEWVEVLELAKRPDESVDQVRDRFMQYLASPTATKTGASTGAVVAAVVAALALFFVFRKKK